MKKIKIGQIGIGHNHGEAKMEAVRKFPELFEIVGYAEENERWIEKRGANNGYEGLPRMSVEEVIAKSDAILVESDVWDLTRYAQMCVDAGKHIHMDKPASGTLEEYKYLIDTAKEKNLVVQLGYMYRYNPAVLECFEHIKNGDLGEIYSINADIWWPFLAVGLPVVVTASILLCWHYFTHVDYICPQCHEVFKPKFKEAFWANHTPTTRKLTCPHCGHKGFCVETYGGK